MDWLTKNLAVGGMLLAPEMADAARQGVTHIINLHSADDTKLAEMFGIKALWNHTPDDFDLKPPSFFQRSVDFAKLALADKGNKLLVHCAAGIHRAPMTCLAILCSQGWALQDAMQHIHQCRYDANFPGVYVESVRHFLHRRRSERENQGTGRTDKRTSSHRP